MGSGLILLVIVGAWLAVLVPMALRSHDASSLGTVERFSDAMRVLSRRSPAAPVLDDEPAEDAAPVTSRRTAPAAPSAARRLKVLLALAAAAVVTLVAGVVGPRWVLAVHAAADVALAGYVVWLRRQAVLRAEREWRAAMAQRPARRAPRPVVEAPPVRWSVPARVAGIPDVMPSRAEVTGVRLELAPPLPVLPARGAQGEPWSPVPVPVPTYVTAPTAPRRVQEPVQSLAEAERSLGIDDQGPDLDEILDRRRAVGD